MKAVRRQDLINLITSYYWEFIDPEHKPINDSINGHGNITIDIDSIYISISIWNFRGLFPKDDVKKVVMNEFEENLEAVTFGNLKVIGVRYDMLIARIEIANAYEVIE